MGFKLGKTSKSRLDTCHKDIVLIIEEAIKVSPVDFGVAQGERTIEQQQEYFDKGNSRINPQSYSTVELLLNRAKHIVDGNIRKKSEAVDVFAYYNGKAQWDNETLCLIAGVIISVANKLYDEGKITHKLRWGGNWDSDGVIISDQSFQDLPHFELLK